LIAHFSIPSRSPRETALFFAAVIDGLVFDFPPVPGASIAVARDRSGLAVEVYPEDMAHHPGAGNVDPAVPANGPAAMPWEDQIFPEASVPHRSGFHVAIGSRLGIDEVVARAKALGWRALACERAGVFGVVEVWIDDRYLVEVVVPAELERYRAFMQPDGCRTMFGEGVAPPKLEVGGSS
jgi:hypothetical protein